MKILRSGGIQRSGTKIIKRVKDYSYSERLEKLGFTILLERKMRGGPTETFQLMKFLVIIEIFPVLLLELEIYYQDRFKKLLDFFTVD